MKYIITLIFVLIYSIQAHASDKPIASSQCAESFSKNKMLGGIMVPKNWTVKNVK